MKVFMSILALTFLLANTASAGNYRHGGNQYYSAPVHQSSSYYGAHNRPYRPAHSYARPYRGHNYNYEYYDNDYYDNDYNNDLGLIITAGTIGYLLGQH